jgi:hypothetical protein
MGQTLDTAKDSFMPFVLDEKTKKLLKSIASGLTTLEEAMATLESGENGAVAG